MAGTKRSHDKVEDVADATYQPGDDANGKPKKPPKASKSKKDSIPVDIDKGLSATSTGVGPLQAGGRRQVP
ncbi:hypothetical protein LTR95_010836 [Oleoguttula sp. CCFEE 5521]